MLKSSSNLAHRLSTMSIQLNNLRTAYLVLEDRVRIALRTQLGDAAHLNYQRDEALVFLASAEQVRVLVKLYLSHLHLS